MSNVDRNAKRYVALQYKVYAWSLLLDKLVRAGHFYERQKTLAFRIRKGQEAMRKITPDNLARSDE